MDSFIESFTKVQKNKISLFAHLHVLASSYISNIYKLRLAGSLLENHAEFAKYV